MKFYLFHLPSCLYTAHCPRHPTPAISCSFVALRAGNQGAAVGPVLVRDFVNVRRMIQSSGFTTHPGSLLQVPLQVFLTQVILSIWLTVDVFGSWARPGQGKSAFLSQTLKNDMLVIGENEGFQSCLPASKPYASV